MRRAPHTQALCKSDTSEAKFAVKKKTYRIPTVKTALIAIFLPVDNVVCHMRYGGSASIARSRTKLKTLDATMIAYEFTQVPCSKTFQILERGVQAKISAKTQAK
jgi:hypothetical protein